MALAIEEFPAQCARFGRGPLASSFGRPLRNRLRMRSCGSVGSRVRKGLSSRKE
jgi:hypothetical protein